MKYYTEIVLFQDIKTLYELWSFLYSQTHFTLASWHKKGVKSIGVSFPEYRLNRQHYTLGDTFRIFAPNRDMLAEFVADLTARLDKYDMHYRDHYHFKSIKPVPEMHAYTQFRRKREREDKETKARRYAKRHGISYQEALKRFAGYEPQPRNLPFLLLKSQSNSGIYRCYIEQVQEIMYQDAFPIQEYDTFGAGGLVPYF